MEIILLQVPIPDAGLWHVLLDKGVSIFITLAMLILQGRYFIGEIKYWQDSTQQKDEKLIATYKESMVLYVELNSTIDKMLSSAIDTRESIKAEALDIKRKIEEKHALLREILKEKG